MTKPSVGELVFFWILFGIVGLLTFAILSPYAVALFLSGIFAIVFYPLYDRLQQFFRGRETLAALIVVLLIFFLVLAPFIYFGILLFKEIVEMYGTLTQGGGGITASINNLSVFAERHIQKFIPDFQMQTNAAAYIGDLLTWAAKHLNGFFSGVVSLFFQLFLTVVSIFFLLRDGARLRNFAIKWSPLPDQYDKSIIAKIETAVSSIVKGTLLTAVIQGLLIGLGFAFFGVPNPVLWGVVGTIAALLPLVGTGAVIIPAGAWLLYIGHIPQGIGLILWGVCCVGLIDNILRPLFIQRGVHVHPFLILLSVLGGLAYFGPVGFLAGPVVLTFFFVLLGIYPQIIKGHPIEESHTIKN